MNSWAAVQSVDRKLRYLTCPGMGEVSTAYGLANGLAPIDSFLLIWRETKAIRKVHSCMGTVSIDSVSYVPGEKK